MGRRWGRRRDDESGRPGLVRKRKSPRSRRGLACVAVAAVPETWNGTKSWCARLGSNQQPLPSEGSTLSIELRALRRSHCLRACASLQNRATSVEKHACRANRVREDTRFRAIRPSDGLVRGRHASLARKAPASCNPHATRTQPTRKAPSAMPRDAGKRAPPHARSRAPPVKRSVYNRPCLRKSSLLSRCR